MQKTKEIPVETAAALLMACVAIEDVLQIGQLTDDIKDELNAIRPYLIRYMESV